MRLMREAIDEGGGTVIRTEGDAFFAAFLLRRSLADTPFLPGVVGTGATIWILATVAFERGQFERALRLMGFSEALAERTGSTPPDVLLGDLASHLSAAGTKLGQEATDRLRTEGRSMSVDEAIAFAMSEQ
jgi:class 3 adenylate cyclase